MLFFKQALLRQHVSGSTIAHPHTATIPDHPPRFEPSSVQSVKNIDLFVFQTLRGPISKILCNSIIKPCRRVSRKSTKNVLRYDPPRPYSRKRTQIGIHFEHRITGQQLNVLTESIQLTRQVEHVEASDARDRDV